MSLLMLIVGLVLIAFSIFQFLDYYHSYRPLFYQLWEYMFHPYGGWRPVLVIMGVILLIQYPIVTGIAKRSIYETDSKYSVEQLTKTKRDPVVERLQNLFVEGKIDEDEYLEKKKLLEE